MILTVEETQDMPACFALRAAVFTAEQGIAAAIDVDGTDDEAVHFLARLDDMPVGTARYLVVGDIAKIGRVCVLRDHRGVGYGVALIRAAMAHAKTAGLTTVKLGAQESAIGFYERLGFEPEGDMFLDADIPHLMLKATL